MHSSLTDLALFLAGFVSWTISTLSAGGGSMLLLAATAALLRGHAVAPVVTFASLCASPARIILFWRDIDWRVVRWYLPGATAGALLGGWAFTRAGGHLLQVCIGLFLLSTLWQYRLGHRAQSFRMRLSWFLPVSFASGVISGLVGASGLLANPFYLNYGLAKEQMLATRAVNSLAVQVVKIAAYIMFGVLSLDHVRHGIATGAGASVAIWLTRPWLQRLDVRLFRQFAVAVMVFAGASILWQQRQWLLHVLAGG